MDIAEIKQKALVLDKVELEKLKDCFNYLHHRANKHPDSYAARGQKKFINYMRMKFKDAE